MRLQYALKNSIFGVVSQIVVIACGIVLQRVMVINLGDEINGLNSVFTNIVSILSLSEMGVASAIVYNLYKPIAENDREMITRLMNIFKLSYRIIALCVAVAGIVISIFVNVFVEDGNFNIWFVRGIFLLFTANTSLSYLFSYKRSLMTANQKAYIMVATDLVTRVVTIGVNFFVLIYTHSIVWYLVVNIITTFCENVFISTLVDRKYPFIKTRNKADKALAKKVFKDVKNIFIGKLSGTILNSTDYVIISTFVGVVPAGLYYNYNLIINSINGVINKVLNGLQASIGDMFVERNNQKNYDILRQLSFIFSWTALVCSSMIFSMIDTFVGEVWLTRDRLLPLYVIAICVVVFFLVSVRGPLWSMLAVSGLFAHDKYISLIGAASNLIVSLVFVQFWGMFGVFVGTLVSQTVQLILKIRLFFGKYLQMSAKRYIIDLIEYFIMFFITVGGSYLLCAVLPIESAWLKLCVQGVVSFAIPNLALFLYFHGDKRLKSTIHLAKYYLKRGK